MQAHRSVIHPQKSSKREKQSPVKVPLNFLLGHSQADLDSFMLARLAAVANLRSEMQDIMDRLIDELTLAGLASWFRETDRESLKRALETEESALEFAKRMIRGGGEIIPRICLNPGQAHRTAAVTYQKRNIAEGRCSECPKPLARNSVRFCEKHLAMNRARYSQKKALSNPGSREFLYAGEVTGSTHGRQPGSLASLAMHREQKTRAILAELGIPPESAAVSLHAAKEALLGCMPAMRGDAMTQAQLFAKAMIPTKTTGQNALKELISAGQVERIGKGIKGDPYLYFLRR